MPRAARKRKRREGAGEVPLDSMSDIAFLLIIFFLIATTLTKVRGFITDLPAGKENTEQQEEKNNPTITLVQDRIHYDEIEVTLDELRDKLFDLELSSKDEELRIIKLEANEDVRYGHYYPVWAAIVKAGGVVAIVETEE